jgi:hypothetical protein
VTFVTAIKLEAKCTFQAAAISFYTVQNTTFAEDILFSKISYCRAFQDPLVASMQSVHLTSGILSWMKIIVSK